jgi:3-oxoacyl-[acyl-carrier protein] reductase
MERTKIFLLTGCASGMGRHLATCLLQRGHRVIATDVNFEAMEAQSQEKAWPDERTLLRRLDVTDPEAWEEVLEDAITRFGHIDVCMNIAGYLNAGKAYDSPPIEVHRHIDINVKGVMFGTMAAGRHMAERRAGHIINISSIAGLVPCPGLAVYSASKYAVRAYSLAAAEELRPFNVAVTAICPFSVRTPMFDRQTHNEQAAMMFSDRALTVDDIERAVLDKALSKRPLEIYLPLGKCLLARFADLFPRTARFIAPMYERSGKIMQKKLQTM